MRARRARIREGPQGAAGPSRAAAREGCMKRLEYSSNPRLSGSKNSSAVAFVAAEVLFRDNSISCYGRVGTDAAHPGRKRRCIDQRIRAGMKPSRRLRSRARC